MMYIPTSLSYVSFFIVAISIMERLLILSLAYMKTEIDDLNYESIIIKLAKGSIEDKAQSLKKLLFLYENARSSIYLYERRITECLQLSLLIQERDISLNALTLLEKIIMNTSSQSEIMHTIKKRLLSKMVVNLGSIAVTVRKVSHKCLLQFLRKFKDLDTVIALYLKTAILQRENSHLKLKAINSFHSLLMAETKYFSHQLQTSKQLMEQLIHASFQKEYGDVRRAGLICLIFILKIKGAENNLKNISETAQSQLNQLRYQNQQLALLLDSILKTNRQDDSAIQNENNQNENNTPSPKFISIEQTQELKPLKSESPSDILDRGLPQLQLKIFNEVSFAQQFLKKLQKTANWELNQIQEFAPFLEKCLTDESIKLFSISKKIVEVIFNSDDGKKKEYYVVLVPCIVNGIGNKRFIVRKNLDKLVRQYMKNHTEVWVQNIVQRFAQTKNYKVKEILIDLVMHAYRTSPEFYYPTQRTFQVFDIEMNDTNSTLKRKVIDCILFIIERQSKDDKSKEEMLNIFSADPLSKIMRKIGKNNNSLGSLSQEGQIASLEPISPIYMKKQRKIRLVTAEPQKINFLEKSEEKDKSDHISQEKYKNRRQVAQYSRERRVRNSHIQISFKAVKKQERRSKDQKEKISLEKLPQLKKVRNSSSSKYQPSESPVKRSIGERNIVYVDRQNLKPLQNPKAQLQKALVQIKDSNWSIQFQAISKVRSIVEFNKELISDEIMVSIVNELLQNLSNLRSGVTKLALICLNQMMRRFHRRMYQFTENIILTIIKKSITTSEFMQDEIKRCIATAIEELCLPKIISALNSVKQSRSMDIKMTFMLCVQSMIKAERIYRKQYEWIWAVLVYFNEQPQFNLRSECKRMVKLILETYKDWKQDLGQLKKDMLQKIDRLLKSLSVKGENNLWLEIQNYQFEKVVMNKLVTSKYFNTNFSKFEEMDRAFVSKKNWKERMKLLNQLFASAIEHPAQFENSSHAKKYLQIAIQQIDEKNTGLFVNAINNLIKAVDCFPATVEELLGYLLEKIIPIFEGRRGEIVSITSKLLNKLYNQYDSTRIAKQYFRMLVSSSKSKNEILNQLLIVLRDNQQKENENREIRQIILQKNANLGQGLTSNNQNIFIKSIVKLCSQKNGQISNNWSGKLRELIVACQRKFGQQFTTKLMANPKILEIMN